MSVGEKKASVFVTAEVEGGMEGDYVKYILFDPEGGIISTSSLKVINNEVTDRIEIQDARFWWPTGLGKQPLYTIDAQLVREVRTMATSFVIELTIWQDSSLHRKSRKIGLRTVSLVQRALSDQPGKSFFFQVNGVPVFSSGSNWCPADHFLPRVTPERYRTLLQMAVDGNQNMLR